uniref:Protein TIC 20 n=1 Tax=Tetraselmis chuii TaxID=63592 RepID=A0A7S1T4M4_9CHLO|mmetsp:Transcript_4886/g.8851  ORF Transcript_4886/g.8851 Transcript_4886/m.8851 type:complete len:287 (+) Transcript_4886:302-1162(+)|eukprot:CAMPEP_0177769456 /NCGR_PEP_ID=MMETSP0491_2-20121128/10333_1 /TAXON_ID=63592 /ORGANISM="Tetraselmis chuii, Strain PLY429" /LENGTH=286 /DNA_ID=CAMNT_0019286469 /DNA_START=315 /DNA_END=1175 /DNA_ORIENTATION=+
MLCMSAVWGRCASSVIGTAGGRATVSVRRKSAARISVLASVSRGPLRCRATGDRNSEERTSKETIGRLERLLGIEPEQEEPEIPRQDVPKERKQEPVEPVVVKSEKEKKRPSDFEEPDWILAEFETDGKPNVPNRALSSASYLLPLLDGLHYGRYFFMQVPQFSLLLLPLVPAINLFESARWLQIVAFFGLALGVANNRNMPTFTRFNAQQAILLDILQILPDLLLGNRGPTPGGNEFLMQATIIGSNTVFLYVYLCCVGGAVASLNGKAVRLPLLGGAAESQSQR